ncbi:MAG TPA: DUF2905 domain-containing protein [Casimicrobiaceae bacterium]|jgi:hypothetical protein|nr:DUF2905 domain-containing protein [Casimicrobiaceae bacterium]
MQRVLIVLGVVIVLVGVAWPWIARLGLGRLPGDINIERDGWSFHFPIVTSIVVSIVLSILFWIFRK